jgi:hypothetical protein
MRIRRAGHDGHLRLWREVVKFRGSPNVSRVSRATSLFVVRESEEGHRRSDSSESLVEIESMNVVVVCRDEHVADSVYIGSVLLPFLLHHCRASPTHSLMVLSALPEASVFPLGEMATELAIWSGSKA